MTLYEIDYRIACFEPEVDENGELLNAAELDALNLERDAKVESICLYVKNLTAEADAIRAEEKALAERRKSKENKAESLLRYLEAMLAGQTFETAKCKVSYRKTQSVDVAPEFVSWALKQRDDLLRFKAPEPDKTAIKAAIKAGETIPGAALVENVSMTVR